MGYLLKLKDLVELCISIQEAPLKLDQQQKDILRLIICGSIVQRYFVSSDTLKDKYYYNLSSKVMKQVISNLETYSNIKDE